MAMAATPQNSGNTASLARLAEYDAAFDRARHVMEILASNGLGLGEVLRDYAEQTASQMQELMQAAEHLRADHVDAHNVAVLQSTYTVLSSAATVLDMTPAAMQRNRADVVGDKEKVSREEIVRIARAFRHAPEVQTLLASEENCLAQVQLALKGKCDVSLLASFDTAEALSTVN